MDMNNQPQPVMQKSLPNATAVLVLGICSIVFFCFYEIIGLTCGIIALVLASKDKNRYNADPAGWTEASLKNLNAGKVCAIIGTVLSSLFLVYVVIVLAFVGTVLTHLPWSDIANT